MPALPAQTTAANLRGSSLTAAEGWARILLVERLILMFASRPQDFLPTLADRGKKRGCRRRKVGMPLHHFAPGRSSLGDGSPVDITAWRFRCLAGAGFPHDLANHLAKTPGIDIHALLDLVDRGCPPELAARILAPLPGVGAQP
jgi:hypothetical protein